MFSSGTPVTMTPDRLMGLFPTGSFLSEDRQQTQKTSVTLTRLEIYIYIYILHHAPDRVKISDYSNALLSNALL